MYTPLKVATDYSILKSLIKIKDLIDFCLQKNINACGICDSNLYGVIEFYKQCLSNNIKPIIGLEITINNCELYLYARNYQGYLNLLKINTHICEHDINIEFLKKYYENIIVIVPYKSLTIYKELSL